MVFTRIKKSLLYIFVTRRVLSSLQNSLLYLQVIVIVPSHITLYNKLMISLYFYLLKMYVVLPI